MFIVCVAVNSVPSCDNVARWANEIRQVVPKAPIVICLTKKDLQEYVDEPVTEAMIEQKKAEQGFQGHAFTSSKEWEDFNVHRMFQQAIATGYYAKYDQ